MKPYRHMLVGLDFSPASIAALQTAQRLSESAGIRITVIHVIEKHSAAQTKREHGYPDAEFFIHTQIQIRQICAEAGVLIPEGNMICHVGEPFKVLMDSCQKLQVDLLMLGSRGDEHCSKYLGTVASKCLRAAPVDVMLVREHVAGPFKKVLVCVDLTAGSVACLYRAAEIAHQQHADLNCLHIQHSRLSLTLANAVSGGEIPTEEAVPIHEIEHSLDVFIRPILSRFESLQWTETVQEGFSVCREIVSHVQSEKHDLVVLNAHTPSHLHRLFGETTVGSLIDHTACSILAVRTKGQTML